MYGWLSRKVDFLFEIHVLFYSLGRLFVLFRVEMEKAVFMCGRQVMVGCSTTTAAQTVMLTPSTTLLSAPSLRLGSQPSLVSPALE